MLLLALTFSTNMNASSASVITIPASETPVLSNFIAISGKWWNNDKKKNRCRKCGSRKCKGKCDKPDKPDSIPLDGGLSILLIGGAAFGIRKLFGNKNDKL
ncbi:hypothetical protein GCM10022397_42660 [Flavivirga jejuensis]